MKIAILDDHLSVAQSMAMALESIFDEPVLAITPDKLDFQILKECEVLLLDFDYGPLGDANRILKQIEKEKLTHLKIIVFSSFAKPQVLMVCRHALVMGYVNKLAGLKDLSEAINQVTKGKTWYQPKYKAEIKQLMELPKSDVLTTREKDIIRLARLEHSREEIANELHISVNTVGTHLGNIFQKLGVNSMREL